MPANMNKWIAAGTIVNDPELKFFGDQKCVCKFRFAVNKRFRDTEKVLYIDCQAWSRQGEIIAQHCAKGCNILVEAELELEQWETQDGQKRSKISANVYSFQFCGASKQQQTQAERPQAPSMPPPADVGEDSEPPF